MEILKGQLAITQQDAEHFLWHSFWLLIRKSDRIVVGSADFKDAPNANGEVEIGYGLGKEFEHHGYMTEAVKAMCDWAKTQKSVHAILAETELDGFASQRILQRCGFKEEKRAATIWWRLT
ncbi:MAG: GNAT family N-acetyltransferase [Ruthenibacterium sp.]